MRTTFLVLFYFILRTAAGQTMTGTNQSFAPVMHGDRLKIFLDSIKTSILADTIKFNPRDLVFTAIGRQNDKHYSKLYIINGVYIYKMDIINGLRVSEFINEILDDKKVKSITYLDGYKASLLYGQNALQGIFFIAMFDKAKFNPVIAGLTLRKRKSGDNFSVRKKGEVLIRY